MSRTNTIHFEDQELYDRLAYDRYIVSGAGRSFFLKYEKQLQFRAPDPHIASQ